MDKIVKKLKNIVLYFKKDKDTEEMKKNNLKYLEKFEADLITALFYDYTRPISTSELMELDRIYKEETGDDLNINYSCSSCILKLLKQCSRLYFKELPDRLPENLRNRGKI